MMRSHFARHVCRTRTGLVRDAIHCRSRVLCLRSSSRCVSFSDAPRLSHSKRDYSTDPFPKNDTDDKNGERGGEANTTDATRAGSRLGFEDVGSATSGTEASDVLETTTSRIRTSETGSAPSEAVVDHTIKPLEPEDMPASSPAPLSSKGAQQTSPDALEEPWRDPKFVKELERREAEFVSEYLRNGESPESANSFNLEAFDEDSHWHQYTDQEWRTPRDGPFQRRNHFEFTDRDNPMRVYSTRQELTWLSDAAKQVLRNQTSGVTVVTAASDQDGPVGATVSSLTSVTLVPAPFFSFNLSRKSATLQAIHVKKAFNVNFLDSSPDGIEVAEKFVGRSRQCSKQDLWEVQKWTAIKGQAPVLMGKEIPYVFRCRLAFSRQVGDHYIVVGEVLDMTPKADVPKPKPNSGFLTYRDGWYREPGLDPDDKRSATNSRRDTQKLEAMKIQEARRLAHEENQRIARESLLSKEKRAEHTHQRRQEAHERKQQGMKIKMMQSERWEENIRKDEREKLKSEMGSQLERDLLDQAHEMLLKKGLRGAPVPTAEEVREEQEAMKLKTWKMETPDEDTSKKKISPKKQRVMAEKEEKKRLGEHIAPWTN